MFLFYLHIIIHICPTLVQTKSNKELPQITDPVVEEQKVQPAHIKTEFMYHKNQTGRYINGVRPQITSCCHMFNVDAFGHGLSCRMSISQYPRARKIGAFSTKI
jgi:hypothetical protein